MLTVVAGHSRENQYITTAVHAKRVIIFETKMITLPKHSIQFFELEAQLTNRELSQVHSQLLEVILRVSGFCYHDAYHAACALT